MYSKLQCGFGPDAKAVSRTVIVWILLFVVNGCGNSGQEVKQRSDPDLTRLLIGTWMQDTHYKPGRAIGDGNSREIEVFAFNQDGTYSSFITDNSSSIGSALLSLMNMNSKGKWNVNRGCLAVNIESSGNILIGLYNGTVNQLATGEIRVEDDNKFWINNVPYSRKR